MSDYSVDITDHIPVYTTLHSSYESDEYLFQIDLEQDALLDPEEDDTYISAGGVAGAIKRSINSHEVNYYDLETIKLEGIGDTCYLYDMNGKGWWCIDIYYGDAYLMSMTISRHLIDGAAPSREGDEETEWRKEILAEAGKLAMERLEALAK